MLRVVLLSSTREAASQRDRAGMEGEGSGGEQGGAYVVRALRVVAVLELVEERVPSPWVLPLALTRLPLPPRLGRVGGPSGRVEVLVGRRGRWRRRR